MQDEEILARIKELVDKEHAVRSGAAPAGEESVSRLEEALDQCWDLLRQRRARRDFGEDPDDATVRPVSEVEGYLS